MCVSHRRIYKRFVSNTADYIVRNAAIAPYELAQPASAAHCRARSVAVVLRGGGASSYPAAPPTPPRAAPAARGRSAETHGRREFAGATAANPFTVPHRRPSRAPPRFAPLVVQRPRPPPFLRHPASLLHRTAASSCRRNWATVRARELMSRVSPDRGKQKCTAAAVRCGLRRVRALSPAYYQSRTLLLLLL